MSGRSLTRRVPFDLLAAVALVALTAVVVLRVDPGTPVSGLFDAPPGVIAARLVTVALGLSFLLFLPGYALVSALFPGHEPAVEQLDIEGEPMAPRFRFRSREGIDALERLTLAIGVSTVVTPVVALALNFTPWGIRVEPLVVGLGGLTVAASVVAAVRRWRLAPEDRFAPNLLPSASPLFSTDGPPSEEDGSYRVANAVFVVGVLVAAAGIGYAVAVPQDGQQFTEVYVLAEDENGTLVADDYPDFVAGESASIAVGVENHEGQRTTYELVAHLQRIEETDDGVEVRSEREIDRAEVTLRDGENETVPLEFTPEEVDDARVSVALFTDSAPADPTAEAAYRSVDLRLDVNQNVSVRANED